MPTVGMGVNEIRLRDETGIARVFYVAKFEEAVYILHAFEKKTQKTDDRDIEIGKRRYKVLIEERRR
jgi:phage-related protein